MTKKALPSIPASEFILQKLFKRNGLDYEPSRQLSREEVESVAYDIATPEKVAENFKYRLHQADQMMEGTDPVFPDFKFDAIRILFVLYPTGLIIWID